MFLNRILRSVPHSLKVHAHAARAWHVGERELRLLALLSNKRAKAIDVGANRGIYTYFMRKYFAEVYAIEANPFYAGMLRSMFRGRVTVVEAAASESSGTIQMWIPTSQEEKGMATVEQENPIARAGCESIEVKALPIDSLNLDQVDLIKIDVEGHELAVLKGSVGLVSREAPTLVIEIEERHRKNAIVSVRSFLESLDYQGLFLYRGRLLALEEFDASVHQAIQAHESRGNPSDYVNNILFVNRRNVTANKRLSALR